MKQVHFNADGCLHILPAESSSARDFDFFIGQWKVKNRKLKSRLDNCREWEEFEASDEDHMILDGLGNTNTFRTNQEGKNFEGITLRLFNPVTGLWSLYWADSNNGVLDVPVVGSFNGDIGQFFCRDFFRGKTIIVQFHWDKSRIDHPVWSQAFSEDGGKNWEWNLYMEFERTL